MQTTNIMEVRLLLPSQSRPVSGITLERPTKRISVDKPDIRIYLVSLQAHPWWG